MLPAGGALCSPFGFRGHFILGAIFTAFDLIGRILLIERKDVVPWKVDLIAPLVSGAQVQHEKPVVDDSTPDSRVHEPREAGELPDAREPKPVSDQSSSSIQRRDARFAADGYYRTFPLSLHVDQLDNHNYLWVSFLASSQRY